MTLEIVKKYEEEKMLKNLKSERRNNIPIKPSSNGALQPTLFQNPGRRDTLYVTEKLDGNFRV